MEMLSQKPKPTKQNKKKENRTPKRQNQHQSAIITAELYPPKHLAELNWWREEYGFDLGIYGPTGLEYAVERGVLDAVPLLEELGVPLDEFSQRATAMLGEAFDVPEKSPVH